jgi:brefeldin A-inhibited guanine nucleotide-exchange protein
VRLAFDTIEKIIREHFGHITETEAATFTDAVNCLIAFTNNPHSLEVALSAIAFLRFCASRLAEGLPPASPPAGAASLRAGSGGGGLAALPPPPPAAAAGPSFAGGAPPPPPPPPQPHAPAAAASSRDGGGAGATGSMEGREVPVESNVYYWFPLLAGLSELTFDPRGEIRYSALEVGWVVGASARGAGLALGERGVWGASAKVLC